VSFLHSRSPDGSPAVPAERPADPHSPGRVCLAVAFAVAILCTVLKTSGAHAPWMGGLLGLSAGLVGAFVFLGWQPYVDELARHRRQSAAQRR
jgi:hypothetical protein